MNKFSYKVIIRNFKNLDENFLKELNKIKVITSTDFLIREELKNDFEKCVEIFGENNFELYTTYCIDSRKNPLLETKADGIIDYVMVSSDEEAVFLKLHLPF